MNSASSQLDEYPSQPGRVFLVGAGPGDPGLITLRGVECLRVADVVLFDYLVNPVIAEHAPASAELVCLGRHGRSRIWTQDEINQHLLKLANSGKTVVRLKGGDPAVFARGGEEVAFLARHGVPVEIVPGITAALAAGSHLGIPITHREMASAVALVTGHEKPDKSERGIDYAALAAFPGTLVFYMGVTTAAHWSAQLIENGMAAETPVAIVRRISLPDQRAIYCRLDEVTEALTPYSKFPPPVIVIVGPVANQKDTQNWFEQRPLFGQSVVVTRPREQAAALGSLLTQHGAKVIYRPAIAIEAPEDWQPVDQAIGQLDRFDWVVFSSANGVKYFFQRLFELGKDIRALAGLKYACIGSATTAELAKFHLITDVQPQSFRAEALVAELADFAKDQNFLLVRASRGRDVLPVKLAALGATITEIVAYHSRDVEGDNEFEDGIPQWITVTSSAIARSLVHSFGEQLRQFCIASISPITSNTLRELGFEPTVEASTYTMPGLVDAILSHRVD